MELYYGNRPKGGGNWIVLIPYLLSCLPAAALLITLAAPYVDPDGGWLFAIAALYAPYTYLVTFVVAICWVVARRWFAVALVAIVVVATFGVGRYYSVPIFSFHNSSGVNILTLNCDGVGMSDSLTFKIAAERRDIVTLQRVDESLRGEIEEDLKRYHISSYDQLLTLSRYPIVGRDSIDKIAQITDLVLRGDTLRIVNAQLQRSLLTQGEYDDELMRLWFAEYGYRSTQRAKESRQIDSLVSASPYRVVLTVSMEDVAQSYTYQRLTTNLEDSYIVKDFISPQSTHNNYTRTGERHRLEYIFVSEGIDATLYYDLDWTREHRAVEVSIKIK